jgi:hypothetical protein
VPLSDLALEIIEGLPTDRRRPNIMLAGGIDLARDLRNGRNFEYYSEDPYLSAVLGAEAVNGIQGEASSRRSSTTRSTATKPTATGWTRSSTPPRTASPICSRSRLASSAPSPARS